MLTIQKARQMARRCRAAVACTRCKSAKIRCSDFRPCKQCLKMKVPGLEASVLCSFAPLNTTMSEKDMCTVDTTYSSISRAPFGDASRMLDISRHAGQSLPSPAAMGLSSLSSNGAHSLCDNTERQSLEPFNRDVVHRPFDFILPIAQDRRMHASPSIAQPSMMVGPACLPHPVAALLCALTLPVPHPPPPPNALSILLAMASEAAPQPSWQAWRE